MTPRADLSIVPLRGERPPKAQLTPRRGGRNRSWTRRDVLRFMTVGGTTLGLSALKVFRPAREALADGYDIYNACPGYAANHDCEPGCGPSAVCDEMDDGHCCRDDGSGWHWNGRVDEDEYRLRANQCHGGWADGWIWRYGGACGCCLCGITYKCHDGKYLTSHGWINTVCRHVDACDCLDSDCYED